MARSKKPLNTGHYCFMMAYPTRLNMVNIDRLMRKSANICKLNNCIAVSPQPDAIVCAFSTLNDAKRARNELRASDYMCGNNIMNCHVSADTGYINIGDVCNE